MKYYVRRTSSWRDEAPCEGAERVSEDLYTIEVDDLNAFVKKYGKIVLKPKYKNPWEPEALMSIEIYDGYRE